MNNNEFNKGDIVKIQDYDETIDNNLMDISYLKGCVFEIEKVDINEICPYGLKTGEEDLAYFEKKELKIVCKKEDRLDLKAE